MRREQQPKIARKFLNENRWDDRAKGLRGLYDQLFNGPTAERLAVASNDVNAERLQNISATTQTRIQDVEVRSLEKV